MDARLIIAESAARQGDTTGESVPETSPRAQEGGFQTARTETPSRSSSRRASEAPPTTGSHPLDLSSALQQLPEDEQISVKITLSTAEAAVVMASHIQGVRISGAPEMGNIVLTGNVASMRSALSSLTVQIREAPVSPLGFKIHVTAPDANFVKSYVLTSQGSDVASSPFLTLQNNANGISFFARSENSPFTPSLLPASQGLAGAAPAQSSLPITVNVPSLLPPADTEETAPATGDIIIAITSGSLPLQPPAPGPSPVPDIVPPAPPVAPVTPPVIIIPPTVLPPAPPQTLNPVLALAVADQAATEDSAFLFAVPAGSFTHPNNLSLTYVATLNDGSPLPAWLSFNAGTQTFTGTPLNADVGTLSVRITASSNEGGAVSDNFLITTANTNDAPTAVTASATTISENSSIGTVIATLTTTDVDAVDTFTYTIVSDPSGKFAISGNQLTLAAGVDYEGATSHNVTVRTTDSGSAFFDQAFTIGVTNVNEAPSAVTDSNAGANSLAENAANGSLVGITASSTDPEGTALTYSLTNDAGGRFAINASTGVVTVANGSLLNFEAATSHAITVQASDGTNTSSQGFTISLTNVNEAPTDITLSSASIAENATIGTPIATLSGIDADAGDTFTYTLLSDPDAKFSLAGNQLSLNGLLNFETKASHNVQIRVADAAGLTFTKTLTVNVSDVNDAPTTYNQTFNINENASLGTAVVRTNGLTPLNRVAGADEDAAATLTYSILSGNTGSAFSINSGDGTISVLTPGQLDYESTTSYTLTVRVSDGTLFADSVVTVNVNNVNEAPTAVTDTNAAANSIAENSANGSIIGITASSTDPDGTALTYSLTDSAGGRFAINASTGVVTVANSTLLDYESNSSHTIIVQASDGTNNTTQSFAISVTNVNEAASGLNTVPPTFNGTEDTPLTLSGISMVDPDNPGTNPIVTLAVASGTLTVNTSAGGGLTAGQISGNGSSSVTLSGSLAAINATLADATGVTYTPLANANGTVVFTVTTDDGSGAFDIDSVNINLTAVNDAPVNTLPATYSGAEDTPLSLTGISVSDVDGTNPSNVTFSIAAGHVLTLRTDVSGGLTSGQITGNGTNSVSITGATLAAINATLAAASGLIYTPLANANGNFILSLAHNDGTVTDTDTSSITLTTANDAPVVAAPVPVQSFDLTTAYAYTIPGGTFTEPESQAMTYTMAYSTDNGATFTAGTPAWLTFNPATLALSAAANTATSGTYLLRLTASDGALSTPHIFTLNASPLGLSYTGGVAQTMTGGTGNDLMNGGDGNDLIFGNNGSDTIFGRGGNDNIQADILNFSATGFGVPDLIYGGDGNDTLDGDWSSANSTTANDSIYGENGNDSIFGRAGSDQIYGGANDDTIRGGLQSDVIYGEDGNDSLMGEEDNESIFGGNGTDTLIGGPGSDTLAGGAGIDRFEIQAFAESRNGTGNFDIITDFVAGTDLLRIPFFTGIVEGLGNGSGSTLEWYQTGSGGTAKTIVRANPAQYDFYMELTGHINLTASDFLFYGTSGTSGNDTLNGTTGTDAIQGNDGNDLISGSTGNDVLFGGNGDDTIYGSTENDEIYGNAGNDWLDGGTSSNLVFGGDGDDTITLSSVRPGASLFMSYHYGNAGSDVFRTDEFFGLAITSGRYSFIEDYELGIDRIWLDGLPFTGVYIGGADGSRTTELYISYDAGSNTTSIQSNMIIGDRLNIILRGNFATNANPALNLSNADFTFTNTTDNSVRDADATSGVIRESNFASRSGIIGTSGNDTIYAGITGVGGDAITAGSGDDVVVFKGSGIDRSYLSIDHGWTAIDLGLGNDRLFIVTPASSEIFLDSFRPIGQSTYDSAAENNTAVSMLNASLTYWGSPGNDLAIGAGINDDLSAGGSGNDILYGQRSADLIVGNAGNDTLYGGEGAETRFAGEAGNDVLIGGYGGESMWGGFENGTGSGADTFIFYDPLESRNATADRDRILDYGSDDTIVLHGFTGIGSGATQVTISNYTATQFGFAGANWTDIFSPDQDTFTAGHQGIDFRLTVRGTFTFTGGVNGTIVFNSGTFATSGADNMTGTAGNDMMLSLEGNDTVTAGNGNDTIFSADGNDSVLGSSGDDSISAGFGNDTLNGGTGADTMEGGSGTDTFILLAGDSDTVTGMDVIWDFREGLDTDKINLSDAGLDAIAPGGSLDWSDLVFSTPDQIGGYMTRITISGTSFGFLLPGYWENGYNIHATDFVF